MGVHHVDKPDETLFIRVKALIDYVGEFYNRELSDYVYFVL